MPNRPFATETELGAVVRQYLLDRGFLVFEEVPVRDVDGSADLVGVSKDEVWVCECKLGLGLSVIYQASRWAGHCHRTWIAVPQIRVADGKLALAEQILTERGIGLLEVAPAKAYVLGAVPAHVSQRWPAKIYSEPTDIGLMGALHQEHASGNWAKAGAQTGARFTPWVNTCRQLLVLVTEKPGVTVKEAVFMIEHHYRTPQHAQASLQMWAKEGKIAGVKAEFDGRRYRLYPNGPEAAERAA